MDDPEQLKKDREDLWLSLHVQLGEAVEERDRCQERIEHQDQEIGYLLERIAELREDMA